MSTIFPRWTNRLPTLAALSAGLGLALVVLGGWYYLTPDFFEVGYMPKQPVAFSHQLHAGQLGMDCRYCHTHVEESPHANIPSPNTCMNCHTVTDQMSGYLKKAVTADGTSPSAHWISRDLAKVRAAAYSGGSVDWRRIHKVPDYAHFNHSVHLKAGVSCYSCHQRIDEMPVVFQSESLSMGWCLECHRNPENNLIDRSEVRITDLNTVESLLASPTQQEAGLRLKEQLQLNPPQNCGACHY